MLLRRQEEEVSLHGRKILWDIPRSGGAELEHRCSGSESAACVGAANPVVYSRTGNRKSEADHLCLVMAPVAHTATANRLFYGVP